MTDEEAVLKNIKRADYIFAGHSHADHIADIPFIAKQFGSKVIGSRTTTNIALTGGVDKSQLLTISGSEKLDFKDFSVQVIDSEHGALVRHGRKRQPKFEEITKPWSGPITGDSFVEGGSYLYYFTLSLRRPASGANWRVGVKPVIAYFPSCKLAQQSRRTLHGRHRPTPPAIYPAQVRLAIAL